MGIYDYKLNATLNDIEEVLRFLPTIHKNIHVTFEISSGNIYCYNTYVNIGDEQPYHHVKMVSLQDAYDRFFKLLSIGDTVEFQKRQLQTKLQTLAIDRAIIEEEIESLKFQLDTLQEQQPC